MLFETAGLRHDFIISLFSKPEYLFLAQISLPSLTVLVPQLPEILLKLYEIGSVCWQPQHMPLIQTFLRQREVNLWVQDLYSKMARIQEQVKRRRRRREEEKEEGEGGGGGEGGGEGGRRKKKKEEEEEEEETRKEILFLSRAFSSSPFLNQVFCLCVLQIH